MRRRLALAVARAARAVRGFWPDRNPLRRRLDRAEAVAVGGLAVLFLVMAPFAATAAWHMAYSFGTRTAHVQRSWHQAPAVLLASAPSSWESKYGNPVRVRWVAPDRPPRTGTVSVPWGARAGSTVTVWVDASGRLTGLPLRLSQVRGQAVLAAVLAPVVLGILLACARAAGSRRTGQAADGRLGHRLAGNRAPVDQAPLRTDSGGLYVSHHG